MVGRSGWDGYSGQAMGDDVKFEHVRENGNISKSFGAGTESMPHETVENSGLTVCRCRAAESLLELSPPDDHPSLIIDLTSILLILWSNPTRSIVLSRLTSKA